MNNFSRMLGLEDEPLSREADKRSEAVWGEGRGSSNFHGQPFSGLPHHAAALQGGFHMGDVRGPTNRETWGNPDMGGEGTILAFCIYIYSLI